MQFSAEIWCCTKWKKIFLYSYYTDHISKVNEIYSLLYGLFNFPVEFIIYMQNGFATLNTVNI